MAAPPLITESAEPSDWTLHSEQVAGAAARASLLRLCAAAFVAYSSYAICRSPLLPLFARELGAGPSHVGFVMGASTVTGIFVKLPAGTLSDLFGRRRLLLAGALVFATLPFTYLAVSTLTLLIVLRFLHGSATAIFGPVASASLSDVAPPAARGAWLSLYSTAQGAGQAIGPVIAGYLIAVGRFDLAFAISGLIGLGVPLLVTTGQFGGKGGPGSPIGASRRFSWREFTRGVGEVGHDRLILATSGAQAAQFVLHGMLSAFLPLYGSDVLGLSPLQLGWLFGVQTVTTLAMRPGIGLLSDRVGRRWVIVCGLTVCSFAVLSLSIAHTVSAVVFTVMIYAAGVAMTTAATSAFITDVTRRARYGAAHGVFGTIYDVGDALGPLAGGLLVASVGYGRMFQIMAGLALSMAVAFLVTTRARTSLA